MDIVFIKKLKVQAIVGIEEWERKVPQEMLFDIQVASDITAAARSASIDDAINYAEVSRVLADFVVAKQFMLLETLVEDAAKHIMATFKVPWLSIACTKTQVMPNTEGVGVKIVRGDSSVLTPGHVNAPCC